MKWRYAMLASLPVLFLALVAAKRMNQGSPSNFLGSAEANSQELIAQGKQVFRFDTYGDQAFWGGQLRLHEAINRLTPRQVLALGLRVDSDALPPAVIQAIKNGTVNLNDPTITRLLIKLNAVLGVVGFLNQNGTLSSVGLTCAVCHSTVDDSIVPRVGKRIDGLANRDLNVGAIAAAAPNLLPVVNLLRLADAGITAAQVHQVLNS